MAAIFSFHMRLKQVLMFDNLRPFLLLFLSSKLFGLLVSFSFMCVLCDFGKQQWKRNKTNVPMRVHTCKLLYVMTSKGKKVFLVCIYLLFASRILICLRFLYNFDTHPPTPSGCSINLLLWLILLLYFICVIFITEYSCK